MNAMVEVRPDFKPPQAVQMDSPASIMEGLGEIENALAILQPFYTWAAYWKTKYKDQVDRLTTRLFGNTKEGTIPERKAQVQGLLEMDEGDIMGKYAEACAEFARYDKAFEVLDSRRSILQSALKIHLAEASQSRFGQGGGGG